jgi:hypothetical protein
MKATRKKARKARTEAQMWQASHIVRPAIPELMMNVFIVIGEEAERIAGLYGS